MNDVVSLVLTVFASIAVVLNFYVTYKISRTTFDEKATKPEKPQTPQNKGDNFLNKFEKAVYVDGIPSQMTTAAAVVAQIAKAGGEQKQTNNTQNANGKNKYGVPNCEICGAQRVLAKPIKETVKDSLWACSSVNGDTIAKCDIDHYQESILRVEVEKLQKPITEEKATTDSPEKPTEKTE